LLNIPSNKAKYRTIKQWLGLINFDYLKLRLNTQRLKTYIIFEKATLLLHWQIKSWVLLLI